MLQFKMLRQGIVAGCAVLFSQGSLATISNIVTSSDSASVSYSYSFTGTPAYLRIYLDTDHSSLTGYKYNGIGANFLIENNNLYKYSGSNGGWGWTLVGSSSMSKPSSSSVRFMVTRSALGSPSAINLIANTSAGDNSSIVYQLLSSTTISTTSTTSTTTSTTTTSLSTTTTVTSTTTTTLPQNSGSNGTVSFSVSSANFPNPERGFYWETDCRANPKSIAALQAYRSQYGQSTVLCMWYLRDFKSSDISATVLSQLQTQLNNVRGAGFKTILRFVYTDTDIYDAPLSVVLRHLDQLAPYFQQNSDIISIVQVGLIGQWGEMSTSANFGGPSTATDWSNRKIVIDKLLSVVPAKINVSVRTPQFKMNPYGSTPLASSEAFTGTARARVGFYNDCFLSSANDYGTYLTSADLPFVQNDSKYTSTSGEVCANTTYNDCSAAISSLASLHWSQLHEVPTAVSDKWNTQGCMMTIRQRLGYRFELQSASLPTSARVGSTVSISFNIQNVGFGAPYNARPVELVLRNTSTGATYHLALSTDPRRWLPGSTITVSQSLTLPSSVPAGSYSLLLNFPDPAPSLAGNPYYSIQLANSNVWESSTGFNNLNAVLILAP